MRQVSWKSWLLAAALMLLPALAQPSFAQSGGIVSAIRVEGNQRIEPDTVRSYLLVAPGDRYQPEVVDQSLKRLFGTGLFADVKITLQGSTLLVSVVENPIVNRIAFEGNKKLDDDKLRQELQIKTRTVFTSAK